MVSDTTDQAIQNRPDFTAVHEAVFGKSSRRLSCARSLAAVQPAFLIRKVDLHGDAALIQLPFLDREAA